jgi:superfamily I DNA and/or RNA helicase
LTELILQHLERNRKLLVCAPSNIAVDTILNRVIQLLGTIEVGRSTGLAKYRDRIVRIGHPARIAATILQYTLDYHIENDDVREFYHNNYYLLFIFRGPK